LNKKTRVVDVSHSAVLSRDSSRRKAELYKTLAVGQVREGVVKHVLADRAFVDLGGMDAVLELANPPLEVGQRTSFEIAFFDPTTDRIRLKLRS
jgi:4-hydroxy-3-methylbut-2-enyl diphosphate reductase